MKNPAILAAAICLGALMRPVPSQAQLFTLPREQMVELTAQNPFERFPDGRPRVPDALIERARGLSAEEVWAILPKEGATARLQRYGQRGKTTGEGRST